MIPRPVPFHNSPLKIQIITNCYNQQLGGLSRYEKTIINELQKKQSLTVTPISTIKKPSRLKQLFFFLFHKKNLIFNPRAGLTHFLNQQLALSLNFFPFHNVIVTVHDLAFIVQKYYSELHIIERLRYQLVMRGLKRAQWIIVDAEFTKQEIMKYLQISPDKIYVVPLGVDLTTFHQKNMLPRERQKYRHNSQGPVILYVGSEISRMNFHTLVKSVALLKKQFPLITLLKIGESQSLNARQKTMKLIKKLDLEKNIIFLEYVPEQDLVNYYNAADVFVYPIEYTGYGLPVLEALACGCPVITTTTTTLPEVAGGAALLFDPHNVIQLQNLLYTVLTNKSLQKQMQKKGIVYTKKMTWELCAKKTLKVYNLILKKIELK
jgi:glycosyltransferase involved in cell wall biosynthesis